MTAQTTKSTVAEIRARFDADVERFSRLETGQTATMDAVLTLDLITKAATAATAPIRRVLDVGCGAGNYTLKLLERTGAFDCDLVDLSAPMLARAQSRIRAVNKGEVRTFQGDFRALELESGCDVILAAAVLHHLRDDADWEQVFTKLFALTAPGGSVWISDLVSHETPAVQALMWERYGDYLVALRGESYRDEVFAYIDKEDSPRPLTYQLDLLRKAGFARVEILHKNGCFAAFGAIKSPQP